MLADDVVDGPDLGDVVGGADHEVLHQALLQKPAGGALGDAAQHGAELADGQQVGVGFKFAFILESGHGLPPVMVCQWQMARLFQMVPEGRFWGRGLHLASDFRGFFRRS